MQKELTWESLNDLSEINEAKKVYDFRYVEKQLDHYAILTHFINLFGQELNTGNY